MRRWLLVLTLFVVAASFSSEKVHAQGCTQCRDNAAATPPQTQAGYRRAIHLLGGTAALVFGGVVVLMRRMP